jgi:hypothetical protein
MRMPGGIHPGHGPGGGHAGTRPIGVHGNNVYRCHAGTRPIGVHGDSVYRCHAGTRPIGVHGDNAYRYHFLSPLTLSSFPALLALSSFLRILQALTMKCIDMALLRPGTLVPRQQGQGEGLPISKAEAASRNTRNKFLCFAVCPPVILVLGRPVKQWSPCGIGGHAVRRLLQRGQETLVPRQLCASKPAHWRGVGYCAVFWR